MKRPCVSFVVALSVTLLAGIQAIGQVIDVGDADDFSRSLTVSPGGTLTMKVDRGSVKIIGEDENTVGIRVQRRVTRASASDAAKILREEEVKINQTGSDILITAQDPPSLRLRSGWRRPNLEVRYEITVPRKFDAHVETAGGDVKVANAHGRVNIQTSGGGIHCENITGDIDGRTSGGGIKMANIHGNLNIETSGGSLHCESITGDVFGRTSGGGVYANNCQKRLDLETSGGNITIDGFTGPELHASSSGGSVSADFVTAPKADSTLATSGGSVTVRLPNNAAVNLDAHTTGGGVRTELPVQVQGKLSPDNIKGTVNGGGPLLKLQTSGGNIEILKR